MNNTLVNGMALLEVLARSDRALGVSELAARVDLGKSNAHRLLQTLTELGYVRRDAATGTYAAAIRLWELGTAMIDHLDLRELALPAMEGLLSRTRESVHLSVLDGDEVVYLHKLESPEPVRAYSKIGGRAPARCVATGKALLAALNETTLAGVAENLHAFTPKSITDPDAFLQEMAGIRTRGYATNAGEWQETVCGVAAPIHDPAGGVIAAIGVSGPAERLRPGRFKALGAEVVAAADAVERALAGDAEAGAAPIDPCAIGSGGASLSPAPGRPIPQHEEKRRASE
jgi:DNA-binding IclR family transcriptional regulator